jgi:ATP-dependent Clp protease ATP-binding subunit ClpA
LPYWRAGKAYHDEAGQIYKQAQGVLAASRELVRKFRNSQWDVEHILMELLNQKEGLTDEILCWLGVDPALVKQRVEKVLSESPKVAYENSQVYATPRIMQLLQNATAEADRLTDGH